MLSFLAALLLGPAAPQGLAPPCDPAITRADLERTVRFLASDELRGRMTGTPECARAGEYLAAALERAGVQPAGDDGTFLQRVPMEEIVYAGAPALEVGGEAFRWGIDFDRLSGLPPREPLKLVVARAEADLPGEASAGVALFVDASARDRSRWLEARGLPGGAGFGLLVVAGADRPGREGAEPPRGSRGRVPVGPRPAPTLRVRGALLERLRAGSVSSLCLRVEGERRSIPSFNVVGLLRGGGAEDDPALAEQAIVLSAHYDHIGDRPAAAAGEGGDAIFNGADDDASGCAAVLELAERFAADPPPARTLVFFFATGEEIGLVGTEHYLEHPCVPLERTVCNLNFEMIGRPDALAGGPGRLWLTGDERSNLGPELRALELSVVPDPRPDQDFFRRSDNYAFARLGIVAQTLSSYDLHADYHRPSDEADRLDYAHMEACVRAAYAGACALAEGRIDPAWTEGGDPSR